MFNYGIKFPLSESQRDIEWIDIHITCLEIYANQINRNTNNDYIFTEAFFRIKFT